MNTACLIKSATAKAHVLLSLHGRLNTRGAIVARETNVNLELQLGLANRTLRHANGSTRNQLSDSTNIASRVCMFLI